MTSPDRRPTPEAMLARAAAEAERARRGRLKVFFGASPGVGKTYAMLEAARERRAEGTDVVIGWVETHGRAETAALTEGLECLPPRLIEHRGITLRDFDLDAALARRPGLLLLDELAHTNAPGLRHAKRWQDVEELLDAGMDVHTTLNVQHLESVNDLVAQITGVSVRETVPDALLARADEIALIDLPPDDLLERLREGKVYLPEQAERARERFFRKGNLIALRELALRRAAERVDAEAVAWKLEHGIAEAWRTGDRVLVAIGPAPQSADLIRAGYRTAGRLRAPWVVLWVETSADLTRADRDRVTSHLELAERLGAETLVVRGERVADEILAAARERNVSRILVGKPTHARWRDWIRGSLVDTLVRGSHGMDVLVTTGDVRGAAPPVVAARGTASWREFGSAVLGVGVTTVIAALGRPILSVTDQAMLYILMVLLVALRVSRAPSVVASLLGVAAFDFFFVPPFYTFAVGDVRFVLTFAVMIAVALAVSTQTVRIRGQAQAARERERRTAGLYAMTRDFAAVHSAEEILHAAERHLALLTGVPTRVLITAADASDALPEHEAAVAQWVLAHGRPAGRGTDTLPAATGLYLPLSGGAGTLGVAGIMLGPDRPPLEPSRAQLLETYVAQIAGAFERVRLAAEASRADVAAETERTRNALLSAISHDIRTPLAAIAGSAGALLQTGPLADDQRRTLLETIWDEAESLARLVGDLLDLTRLEQGELKARTELCPVEEVVASALSRQERRIAGRPIRTTLPAELLMAPMDPVLIEQVLTELIENACRYSDADAPIEIRARAAGVWIEIEVADRGPGIPADDLERVFDRFYRSPGQRGIKGTGLGLAVCRAIVTAHGGTIHAAPNPGGGTVFTVRLPQPAEAAA